MSDYKRLDLWEEFGHDETLHPDVVQPPVLISLTDQEKFTPCRWCGDTAAYLTKRKYFKNKLKSYDYTLDRMVEIESHAGGLRCRKCYRHLYWLSEEEVTRLRSGADNG